jgi:hypothetical protein
MGITTYPYSTNNMKWCVKILRLDTSVLNNSSDQFIQNLFYSPCCNLKIEEACFSETVVLICESTRRLNPEDDHELLCTHFETSRKASYLSCPQDSFQTQFLCYLFLDYCVYCTLTKLRSFATKLVTLMVRAWCLFRWRI